MPPKRASCATAPGKVILLGEHAVVYGRPALAVPVSDVRARACIGPLNAGQGVVIVAKDLGRCYALQRDYESAEAQPLQLTVSNTLARLAIDADQLDLQISVSSQIPIARGMGSGPAVATAIVRALGAWFECPLPDQAISDLVYETEKVLHGTPSGIDNTVVALERPVVFQRNAKGPPHSLETLAVGRAFTLAIADTGQSASTRLAVAMVRKAWLDAQPTYEALFDEIGAVVAEARLAIAEGSVARLGQLMTANHAALQRLGVSSQALDALVAASLEAGALGAKLSGGGLGGCMIALWEDSSLAVAQGMTSALMAAGAAQVFVTRIQNSSDAETKHQPRA